MAVTYDVTYGNVSPEGAQLLADASDYGNEDHEPGSTEPWITHLVVALMKSVGATRVLETGAFKGFTTEALETGLADLGGGVLHYCEIDPERRADLERTLPGRKDVETVGFGDVFAHLAHIPDGYYDFVFLDDDHSEAHVRTELGLLYPKVAKGGLIALHDVTGACAYIGGMVRGYGGIALDLPRLGPAGGLGIIQKPL